MNYELEGRISEECAQELLALLTFEQHGSPEEETDYQSMGGIQPDTIRHPELEAIWPFEDWIQAIAVRLDPGQRLHAHTHKENQRAKHHVVLEANPLCLSWNGGEAQTLEPLNVYRMVPDLEHESFNYGETPRTHLIIEIRSGSS